MSTARRDIRALHREGLRALTPRDGAEQPDTHAAGRLSAGDGHLLPPPVGGLHGAVNETAAGPDEVVVESVKRS